MPVSAPEDKILKSKVRMLYCDAKGKVYTTLMDKSVYRLILQDIEPMDAENKDYATVGLEIGPGTYAPIVTEITPDESWALSHALDHALQHKVIPDVLNKYLKNIIRTAVNAYKTAKTDTVSSSVIARQELPPILNRLPYYLEKDMEFSMPVYKAEHSYPLIVLKRIIDEGTPNNGDQQLLILDSDGDLAIIKVPFKIVEQAEKRLESWANRNNRHACLVLNRETKGYSVNFIVISAAQRKALDIMISDFTESRNGKKDITVTTRKILDTAKEAVSITLD